jgi:hypothetical protein
VFSGCAQKSAESGAPHSYSNSDNQTAANEAAQAPSASITLSKGSALSDTLATNIGGRQTQASLDEAAGSDANKQAIERKIVRNGKLTIETDSPTAGQQKITAIVESLNGFVITSDFKQGSASSSEMVTITIRVPAPQFNEALEKIRKAGDRVLNENVTGQDVTEEFLDLEARIKTQKALEAQFLEIMKQAKKVSEALEVQTEISNVRTEIERMEGRKRFLENQSSLSTIVITLPSPAPIVSASTSGFSHNIKEAFGDGIDTAAAIILGLIRLIIVLIPIALFILLPLGLVTRFIVRRWRANKKDEPVAQAQ